MNQRDANTLTGDVLDDANEITLAELCRVCAVEHTVVERLMQEGILEPLGESSHAPRFRLSSVLRIRMVTRLQDDLGVNLAGAALALDLLDRIADLRRQLRAQGMAP